MTNLIGLLSTLLTKWNTEERCDFNWEFVGSVRESDLNEYQVRQDNCPVIVAVTDYRFECNTPMNTTTGLQLLGSETHTFNLHILSQDSLGLNAYNEIPNHPIEESKWESILYPLLECNACNPIDFCTELGFNFQVVRWVLNQKLDWLDNNYTGWTINVVLRKNNTD